MHTGVTRRELLLGAGGVAVATGVTPARAAQTGGSWRMFGYDPAHTGNAPDTTGPQSNVGGRWRINTQDIGVSPIVSGIASSPAVVDGTVYIGSDSGRLYALSASDGSEEWLFETDGRIQSAPAVVDGTVYLSSNDGHVYALDPDTGKEQWRSEIGESVQSSPTVLGDTLYIGSMDNEIYALDTADGTERWSYETLNDVSATPAVVDGTVYVGGTDQLVYALNADTGKLQWRFELKAPATATPAVDTARGLVYVGTQGGRVYALDTQSGDSRWEFTPGGDVVASPAIAGDTVYIGSRDGNLYALNADSGEQRWSFETPLQIIGAPSVANNVVYFGTQTGTVYGVLGTDGSKLWEFQTTRSIAVSPAIADGTVFLGNDDGDIYALTEGVTLPDTSTPTPAAGSDDDNSVSLLTLLSLPGLVVATVGTLVGALYLANRAGLFDPLERYAPDPPPFEEATADTGPEQTDDSPGEKTVPADLDEEFPLWDVVLDDVIRRAEKQDRTAENDLIVTKYVDSDTLDSPMVAYEIESLRSEPVSVEITESIDDGDTDSDEIGQLPRGSEGWRVEDGTLVFETALDSGETHRTVVARRDLSAEDENELFARPTISIEPG